MSSFGFDLGLDMGFPNMGKRSPVIPDASLEIDFAQGIVYGASTIESALSFTRASAGYHDDINGNWASFGSGLMRRTNRGLRCEEARTNSLRNSAGGGAVVGTIGSGGSMPTNWQFSSPGGISLQVVSVSSTHANGVERIRFRATGTAASAGTILIAFEGVQQIVAANGQTWTSSFFFEKISGNNPSGGFFNIVTGRNSGGSFVEGNGANGLVFSPTAGVLARTPPGLITLANASSVFVRNGLNMAVANGEVVDITFEVGWPQLELGGGMTSPIRTTTAAAARNSDFATIVNANALTGLSVWCLFMEWEDLTSPSGVFRRLWRYRKDGNNAVEMNLGVDGRVSLGATVAGVAQISGLLSTGVTAASGIYKMAFRFAANNYNAKFSPNLGTQPTVGTNGSIPDLTGAALGIGNVGTDGGQPNCNIRKIALMPVFKSDAEMSAMVA